MVIELGPSRTLADGVSVIPISIPAGPALGRCVTIDTRKVAIDLLTFYELINRSFDDKWGGWFPLEKSSGVNLPQLFSDRTESLLAEKPELKCINDGALTHCLLACNTLHTNFVRGNGFVSLRDGTLVFKPNAAVALDGSSYAPLNGSYSALVIHDTGPCIANIAIHSNRLVNPMMSSIAISGPRIVEQSRNVAHLVPVREAKLGQTVGNEVNYSPLDTLASFTAFGINRDHELVVLSMFAGNGEDDPELTCRIFRANRDKNRRQIEGITLCQMADVLLDKFSVTDAIAGGGAADTQQYVAGDSIWAGEPSGSNRDDRDIEVLGLRGLGAILTVVSSKTEESDRTKRGTRAADDAGSEANGPWPPPG